MNVPTLITLLVVAVIFIAVCIFLVRKGRRPCYGCSNCPIRENCGKINKEARK